MRYPVYSISLYITAKCSLISKCIDILKFCCVKEGCVQYFYKCFNNNAKTCNSRPLNDSRQVITFATIPTETIELPQNYQTQQLERNSEIQRSRSRNSRLTNLA